MPQTQGTEGLNSLIDLQETTIGDYISNLGNSETEEVIAGVRHNPTDMMVGS